MSPAFNPLRLIFAGTPEFAAHHLQALINSPHEIVAVYTQPDRPAGRGKKLTASPVKQLAVGHQLPVFQPQTLKDNEAQAMVAEHHADVMVVVAYGLLLPEAVLSIPRYGCINVHGSLLPRWRGAAPIQRAILGGSIASHNEESQGDKKTGVTIMQMDIGLDTGDMLLKSECDITPDDTSASLHDKLMALGSVALLETLEQIQSGSLKPQKQDDSLANYAEKISKEEAKIDWGESVETIERKIRAYNPFPVAYTFVGDKRIKVCQAEIIANDVSDSIPGKIIAFNEEGIAVACGKGLLLIQSLQIPGKKPMQAKDLLNGYSDTFGADGHFE